MGKLVLYMDGITVFVYGTLLSDFGNHQFLVHPTTEFLGRDTIEGKMYGFGAPIVDIYTDGTVHGELYRINPQTLQRLDNLEGYRPEYPKQSGYVRTIVKTHKGVEAYVYTMTQEDHEAEDTHWHHCRIKSGDYRQHREDSRNEWDTWLSRNRGQQ